MGINPYVGPAPGAGLANIANIAKTGFDIYSGIKKQDLEEQNSAMTRQLQQQQLQAAQDTQQGVVTPMQRFEMLRNGAQEVDPGTPGSLLLQSRGADGSIVPFSVKPGTNYGLATQIQDLKNKKLAEQKDRLDIEKNNRELTQGTDVQKQNAIVAKNALDAVKGLDALEATTDANGNPITPKFDPGSKETLAFKTGSGLPFGLGKVVERQAPEAMKQAEGLHHSFIRSVLNSTNKDGRPNEMTEDLAEKTYFTNSPDPKTQELFAQRRRDFAATKATESGPALAYILKRGGGGAPSAGGQPSNQIAGGSGQGGSGAGVVPQPTSATLAPNEVVQRGWVYDSNTHKALRKYK